VGWDLYLSNCARCHGGKAGARGPAGDLRGLLATRALDSASFVSIVKEGRTDCTKSRRSSPRDACLYSSST